MMRAGVSYADWRMMTHWQRMEFVTRKAMADSKVFKKLENASFGEMLGVVFSRLMGH